MPWFYYFSRVVVTSLFALLTRWEVRGGENVPADGALLVVANHLNLADPPLIGVSLKRKIIFMAKEELFRSRLTAYLLSGLGSFPVHRGKLDREAIRQAKQVLSSGQALVMFPEATRSKTAQLQPAFPGAALMAIHCAAPILPVGISGTEEIKGMGWVLHRPRVRVNIGHPFRLPSADRVTKTQLAEHTNLIMGRIADLLPPRYRGVYGGEVKG